MIASLAGKRVTSAKVQIPAWGLWFAEVSIEGEHKLSGPVTLTLADLTLKGTILSGGPTQGRSHFRMVAGAGGWGRDVDAKSYANDAGVKIKTILSDASAAVGETLDPSVDSSARAGVAFTRPEGQACHALELCSPSAWYVDADGVTRLGARPETAYAGKAPRVETVDLARATVTLAATELAPLVPGVVVDGLTAVDVEHRYEPEEGLRTKIWGKLGGATSRAREAFRALVHQTIPELLFAYPREYRVRSLSGRKLNLQPVRVSSGFPELARVAIWPGVAGAHPTVIPGARVLVAFVDGSPSRPFVFAHENADGPGFVPLTVSFSNGVRPVACLGDVAGPFPVAATGLGVRV